MRRVRYRLLILLLVLTGLALPVGQQVHSQSDSAKSLDKLQLGWSGEIPSKIKKSLNKSLPKLKMGKRMEITRYLGALATIGDFNIIISQNVGGIIPIFIKDFKEITIGEMLEIVLVTNKLAMEIKGEVIRVMTESEFNILYGRPYNETRTFKMVKLKYTRPSEMAQAVSKLKSDRGGIYIEDDASMNLGIMEYPEKLHQIEEVIKKLDIPIDTKTFEPKYAKVKNIEGLLIRTNALTKSGVMKVDDRTNRIIITDTVESLKRISEFITEIDGKPRQVLIESRMIQIELNETNYMGVNWTKILSKGEIVGSYPFPSNIQPISELTSKFKVTVGQITEDKYAATLNFLQQFGDTKIISSPRLLVLNNQSAKFIVGRDEVIVSTQQTIAEGGTTTLKDIVEWKEVGVSLSISPTINADAFITMHLRPEISSVIDTRTSAIGNIYPIIQKTNVETDVIVKDGVTIVIGGLIKDEKSEYRSGIPILQHLPFIGPIFRSTGTVDKKTETVIFLTPIIVSGEADDSVITKEREMIQKQPKDIREIK